MKTLFILLFFSLSLISIAQAPEQISYQAVARNANGQVIANQVIGIKLDLHQGSVTGTVVFSETHTKTTNQLGLFTLGIGSVNTTAFSTINWENGPYFMEVSIDANGGTSYTSMGTQQLMSVPYALYAKNAGGVNLNAGNGISINSGTITNTAPNQTVTISGSGVSGSYPNYTVSATSSPSTSISSGNTNLSITQSGTDYTLTPVTPTLDVIGGTLAGAYPNQTLTVPSAITYTNGTGISITSGSVITNTSPNQTVNISGSGATTVSGAYPNYTVSSSSTPSTSLIQGSNISLNQSGNTYTVSAITPTISAGANVTVSGSSPNYTISSVTPNLFGSGNASVFGGYPNQTISVNPASLSYTPATNVLRLSDGSISTVTLNSTPTTTITGATNVTVAGTAPNYTISSVTPTLASGTGISVAGAYPNLTINNTQPTYVGTAGNISVTGAVINLINSGVTAGQYGANATNGVPTFSVDAFGRLKTAGQYTTSISGDVLGSVNTSTVTKLRGINISTLTPSNGQVLTYDNATTSWVPNIISSPWTQGAGNVFLTTGSNSVGIGTVTPVEKLDVIGNVRIPAVNDYLYATPKTKYYSISSSAFTSENSNTYDKKYIGSELYAVSAHTTTLTSGLATYFLAPVYLPDGATITELKAFVVDNDVNYNISVVQLWRADSPPGTTASPQIMANAGATTGSNSNIQALTTNSIANPIINNLTHSYFIRFGGAYTGPVAINEQNIRLTRILITYTVNKTD